MGRDKSFFVHPDTWRKIRFWQRVLSHIHYRVVKTTRCPRDRIYLGTRDVPSSEPNGRLGRINLKGKVRRHARWTQA